MKQSINGLSVNTFGDSTKQSMVFIHGFPYDHSMWDNQVEVLKENYFCVAYDIRGLGESEVGDGQYMLEFFVDDLFAIINELNLVKPVVCGLSMGGYIALRALERNQQLFGGVILCDTKADADADTNKLVRADNIRMINEEGIIKFTDMFVKNCFAEETPKEQEKIFLTTLYKSQKNNPAGVKGCIIAIMSRTDTNAFLPQITIPALIICGAYDKLTPPPIMRAMADKIAGSEFAAIPAAGHMSPLENPSCVNDLIDGFIKRKIATKQA